MDGDKDNFITSLKWPLYFLKFDKSVLSKKMESEDCVPPFNDNKEAERYCAKNLFKLLGVSKTYNLPLIDDALLLIFNYCGFEFTHPDEDTAYVPLSGEESSSMPLSGMMI